MRAAFADPVLDGQRTFRAVLTAMAHPGRVVEIGATLDPPRPLHAASAAFVLTLADFETPLWIERVGTDAREWLLFHTGAPIVAAPRDARVGLATDVAWVPPLPALDAGSDERPDRSATLVIQVDRLQEGSGHALTGPGIEALSMLHAAGLPPSFWDELRANHARFPRGVDVVLTAGTRLAALPRTTRVED